MSDAAALRSTVWLIVDVATLPPPKNCTPLPGGAQFALGNPRNAGRVGPGDPNGHGNRRRVPYSITVGVPVTVQPGTVTELYPDKDGSPSSAPGFTSKFGLSTRLRAATCCTPAGAVRLSKVCSISRRTQASKAHNVGGSGGATGPLAACGLRPIADNRPETRSVTILLGAAGALTAIGAAWVTTAAVLVWELAVEIAGIKAALTVGDAVVVEKLGTDAADVARAVVLATLTETFEVVAPLVGEPAAEEPPRAVDVAMLESVLLADGVDAVVEGPESAVVVASLVEVLGVDVAVVGSVPVVSVPFTEVLAPPEACTTPACGSVDDPD
jgi:hypothetical protein